MEHSHQLTDPDAIKAFLFAGRAHFTLVSTKTGTRFTFRISKKDDSPFFVSVLQGSDNWSNYKYVGTIAGQTYRYGKKAKVGQDAPSVKAISWFLNHILRNNMPDTVEFWHEGKCGRCGRMLTVPESIATGLGPICAGKNA